MGGLRPSTTGWYSNTSKKPADYVKALKGTIPMPTYFKRSGYKTLAAGKIFHKGTSDVEGYDYWTEVRPKYKWPKDLAAHGHGYQGKGGGHFHPFPPDGGAIYQKYGKGVSGQSLCWGALEKADMPPEGMPDEQIAHWAVERLKQKHDAPFFLAVGFVRPHVPYTAPKEFFDLYPMGDVIVPKVPKDEMDDIPLHGKAMAMGTLEGGDHHLVLQQPLDPWSALALHPLPRRQRGTLRPQGRSGRTRQSGRQSQVRRDQRTLQRTPAEDQRIAVFNEGRRRGFPWAEGRGTGERRCARLAGESASPCWAAVTCQQFALVGTPSLLKPERWIIRVRRQTAESRVRAAKR